MSSLGWAILLVGATLVGEVAWKEYRDWRHRRDRHRHTRMMISRLGLPRA
jgi:hypothetical protein